MVIPSAQVLRLRFVYCFPSDAFLGLRCCCCIKPDLLLQTFSGTAPASPLVKCEKCQSKPMWEYSRNIDSERVGVSTCQAQKNTNISGWKTGIIHIRDHEDVNLERQWDSKAFWDEGRQRYQGHDKDKTHEFYRWVHTCHVLPPACSTHGALSWSFLAFSFCGKLRRMSRPNCSDIFRSLKTTGVI